MKLAGDKFMPEMHLRQPVFTYSAFGPFTKTKKEHQSLKVKLVFSMVWLIEILRI